MRLRPVTCAAALLALSGCGAQLTFIDRADGRQYGGKTTGSTGGASGIAQASIEDRTYEGPWVYSRTGGGYRFSNFTGQSQQAGQLTSGLSTYGYSGNARTSGQAGSLAVSAQGKGMINLRSQDGQFIRCLFDFNTMSNTGIGQCQRNDGREYDLI